VNTHTHTHTLLVLRIEPATFGFTVSNHFAMTYLTSHMLCSGDHPYVIETI